MNELLAQAYGTENNIDYNTPGVEKTAEAALLEELEKVASAEGIDLREFSDDDIIEILSEAMGAEGTEKTAEAAPADEEGQVKLAEADFLGRTMAHAFYDELTSIQGAAMNKQAGVADGSAEQAEAFENAAVDRANEILAAVGLDKQSSASANDAGVEEALNERAAALLDDAGYDVGAIAQALGA